MQRRWVWIEGCAASAGTQRTLERFMRGIPDVELVIVDVSHARGAKPPYRTMDPSGNDGPRRRSNETHR